MGKIKAVQHKNRDHIGFTEPYPAIHYSGSYNDILDIIRLIGIDNLDFPKYEKKMWNDMGETFPDSVLEKYCDRNSNFSLPGKLNDETYPPPRLEIEPRDWVIFKYDLKGGLKVEVLDNKQMVIGYDLIDYYNN